MLLVPILGLGGWCAKPGACKIHHEHRIAAKSLMTELLRKHGLHRV